MIATSKRIGICEICKTEQLMTTDHLIPKWFITDIARYNLNWHDMVAEGKLHGKLWQQVCSACNMAKGGSIYWENPVVRKFMSIFINALNKKIGNLKDGKRKLSIICECKEVSMPQVIDMSVLSPKEAHLLRFDK